MTEQLLNGKYPFAPVALNTESQTRLPRSEIIHREGWKSFRGGVFVQGESVEWRVCGGKSGYVQV